MSMPMQISFKGGTRQLASLVSDLRAANIDFSHEAPMESRTADSGVITAVIVVVGGGAGIASKGYLEAAGADAYEATKRAVKAWQAKPNLGTFTIKFDDDDDQAPGDPLLRNIEIVSDMPTDRELRRAGYRGPLPDESRS